MFTRLAYQGICCFKLVNKTHFHISQHRIWYKCPPPPPPPPPSSTIISANMQDPISEQLQLNKNVVLHTSRNHYMANSYTTFSLIKPYRWSLIRHYLSMLGLQKKQCFTITLCEGIISDTVIWCCLILGICRQKLPMRWVISTFKPSLLSVEQKHHICSITFHWRADMTTELAVEVCSFDKKKISS